MAGPVRLVPPPMFSCIVLKYHIEFGTFDFGRMLLYIMHILAGYTMAGCFAGALLYGAIEPVLSSLLFHKSDQPSDQIWCVTEVQWSLLSS